MPEIFVILTRDNTSESRQLSIAGIVTRDMAHSYGVPHGAVQVAVIIQKKIEGRLQPHILLHQRSKYKKIDPEKWDVCGGHLEASQALLDYIATGDWHNPSLIEQLFWDTALREANEEVYFRHAEFKFQRPHLRCFGQVGMFDTGFNDPQALNREYASLFFGFVPSEYISLDETDGVNKYIGMRDTVNVNGKVEDMEINNLKILTLDQLMAQYQEQPDMFADGISRVLVRLDKEPELIEPLRTLLNQSLKL